MQVKLAGVEVGPEVVDWDDWRLKARRDRSIFSRNNITTRTSQLQGPKKYLRKSKGIGSIDELVLPVDVRGVLEGSSDFYAVLHG